LLRVQQLNLALGPIPVNPSPANKTQTSKKKKTLLKDRLIAAMACYSVSECPTKNKVDLFTSTTYKQ